MARISKIAKNYLEWSFLTKEQYNKFKSGKYISEKEAEIWHSEGGEITDAFFDYMETSFNKPYGSEYIHCITAPHFEDYGLSVRGDIVRFCIRIDLKWHGRITSYELQKEWDKSLGRGHIISEAQKIVQEILSADYSVTDFSSQLSCEIVTY